MYVCTSAFHVGYFASCNDFGIFSDQRRKFFNFYRVDFSRLDILLSAAILGSLRQEIKSFTLCLASELYFKSRFQSFISLRVFVVVFASVHEMIVSVCACVGLCCFHWYFLQAHVK